MIFKYATYKEQISYNEVQCGISTELVFMSSFPLVVEEEATAFL